MALALVGLAVVGLGQTGCRSNGCSNCNIGAKLNNGVQNLRARVFPARAVGGGCSTCGTLGGYDEGVVVDSGVPVTVPGGVVVPGPAATVPPPAIESDPELRALPPAAGSVPGGSASSRGNSGASRSSYEAARLKDELLASKQDGGPGRSARGAAGSPAAAAETLAQPDILDNLPPVDLPPDINRQVLPLVAPTDPPTVGAHDRVEIPPPVEPRTSVDRSTDPSTTATSVEHSSAGVRPVSAIRTVLPDATAARSGLGRSLQVAPQIMGGILPSVDGLIALKRKGYRTIVDLRPLGAVPAGFADQVIDQGLTYIPLPFSPDKLTTPRVDRFNELLKQASLQPIYFGDDDGRRTGLAWYLRCRGLQELDPATALDQARALGLEVRDARAADQLLVEHPAAAVSAAAKSPGSRLVWGDLQESTASPIESPTPTSAPSPTNGACPAPLVEVVASPAQLPERVLPSRTAAPAPVISKRESNPDPLLDRNNSWKPVAALVLSGLGVPLAYWSRAAVFQMRSPRRASLTARNSGPRKALPSSDA